MKLVPLTKGRYAKVDDEDYKHLLQWKWYFHSMGYAARSEWVKGENRSLTILMHNQINKTPTGLDTDHQDRDKLNNQKANLKTKSHSLNMHNTPPRIDNNSGYKGIHWFKQTEKWQVYINFNNKRKHVGYFFDIKDAIKARISAEKEYGI